MPIALTPPIEKVYAKWAKAVSAIVGDNYSMDASKTPGKYPYARMQFLGGVQANGDLEGDEASNTITFQIDSFVTGNKALTKVYELDNVSHEAMVNMYFRRTYQGETPNSDESIKRITSRYTRILTSDLFGIDEAND